MKLTQKSLNQVTVDDVEQYLNDNQTEVFFEDKNSVTTCCVLAKFLTNRFKTNVTVGINTVYKDYLGVEVGYTLPKKLAHLRHSLDTRFRFMPTFSKDVLEYLHLI